MVEHLIAAIKQTLASIAASLIERIGDLDQLLVSLGGSNSRYVVYIALAVLLLMIVSRILKVSFSILQRVVLPAALLAWVAGNYLHFPFFAIFPILVGLGSAWMLFKT